jgi:hypothetical protein
MGLTDHHLEPERILWMTRGVREGFELWDDEVLACGYAQRRAEQNNECFHLFKVEYINSFDPEISIKKRFPGE